MTAREPLDEIGDGPGDDEPDYVLPPPMSAAAKAADDAREWARTCAVLVGSTTRAEANGRAAETALDSRMTRRWLDENMP